MASRAGIRSFVLRQGRLTRGQARALAEEWHGFGLESSAGLIDPATIFGNHHPLTYEIGFGMGDSLITQAQTHPERNFIGVEVHRPGLGHLLMQAAASSLKNIRVYGEDGQLVLEQCIPNESLDRIQIFFPDPWHKKRHHKRRLINAPFLQLVWHKLQPGGVLHLATDWHPYAQVMQEEITNYTPEKHPSAKFTPISPPPRPTTKFETRGQKLGHAVTELAFACHK